MQNPGLWHWSRAFEAMREAGARNNVYPDNNPAGCFFSSGFVSLFCHIADCTGETVEI
jgi:hypothetical protein